MVQSENHTQVAQPARAEPANTGPDKVRTFIFPVLLLPVLLCWVIICAISRQPGANALVYFLLLAALMVVATAVMVWCYHRAGQRIPFLWILLTAAVLRVIALSGEPLFEDDHFRYLWDGYRMVVSHDPYTLAPAEFFDRDIPEIFEPVLSQINYPDIATVYGPVAQWVFALGYLTDSGQMWPLQLFAGLADLLILVLLFRLGAGNALLFYAWSPLLLKEFALTAHPDVYAIAGLIAGIALLKSQRVAMAGVALGLGFAAKVFAVIALPFLLTGCRSLRDLVLLMAAFVLTLAGITLLFGTVQIWVPEGLRAMADSWLFNAGLYLVLLNYFDVTAIKGLLLSAFVLYVVIACARRLRYQPLEYKEPNWSESGYGFRGDWLYAVFLLALPVINPWYVAWVLPFATLYPRWWSWSLSYCCLISYWYGSNAGVTGAGSLQLATGIVAIEYLAIVAIPVLAAVVIRCTKAKGAYARYARL